MNRCKHCGTHLVVKKTKHKPSQLTKQYYYTAYYLCPNCHRIYHNDKFKVLNSALPLLKGYNPDSPLSVDVDIWTDGACANNGTDKARAAWAFISGKHEESGLVEGKQTNNVAEALAIYHALKWAATEGYKHIRIHSDSQITIHSLQKPLINIKANREIFKKIFDWTQEKHLIVHYQKVSGHSGDKNNERVDKLANQLVS